MSLTSRTVAGGGWRASLLSAQHLQLAAAFDRAFLRSGFSHGIPDPKITEHAQCGCPIEACLRPYLFIKGVDLRKLDRDLFAIIFRHFVARQGLQATILLCSASTQCQCNKQYHYAHKCPLLDRVAAFCHKSRRSAKSEQGISLPPSMSAHRAGRPSGCGFLWSGVLRASRDAPFSLTVRLIVARPATRISLAEPGTSEGCVQ